MTLGTAPTGAPRTTPAAPPPRGAQATSSLRLVPAGGLLALLLWAFSLRGVRVEEIDGWGLLAALPPLWFAAFVLTLGSALAALVSRRRVGHGVAVPLAALVALLFGTTSVVYEVARYPWTFKHVGVVEYVLENGSLDRSIDIYHNFPGFFLLAAGIARTTGADPLLLAQWSQPALALLTATAVYWAVGGLTTARRIRYAAVLVHVLGDWIGQNYFAPQALAYPLALFVLGGLLRSVPLGRTGFRWQRLRTALPFDDAGDVPAGSAFWRSRRGAAVLVVAFACVAVSHPLTPVVLLVQSALVCVLLRPARPWLVLAFAAVEAGWLAQAWPFLHSTYELFDFGVDNVEPPQVAVVDPLPGYTALMWAAPLLMAVAALLAAGSVLRALRQRGRMARLVVPLVLAAVPVVMVLGQPYGNEGIFRAYLFALPWVAAVVASELFGRVRRANPGRRAPAVVAVSLVAVLTLPANFAGELSHRVASTDLVAGRWFEANAPAGSTLLPFTSSYPWRSTADYAEHLPVATAAVVGVVELPGFVDAAGDPEQLVRFTAAACDRAPGDGPVFVATGPAAVDTVRLFGSMRLDTYRAYVAALAADDEFTEVFRAGASALFRCRG